MALNTLEEKNILRDIARIEKEIQQLEALLSGVPISVVRIADASITNAKIQSLSVDKLTSGQLSVTTDVFIGDPDSGDYIVESGGDLNIVMYKNDVAQLLIGDDGT